MNETKSMFYSARIKYLNNFVNSYRPEEISMLKRLGQALK